MVLEVIIALILGLFFGTLTGLIPGLHINLVGALLFSGFLINTQFVSPVLFVVFIIAMSITHTFLDFIPSVFIGAPDEETALSLLPGHELLKRGKGFEAVYYTAKGSVMGLVVILIFTPIFLFILPRIELYLGNVMFLILITSSIFFLIKEKSIFWAFIIFSLAGFLGLATLNLGMGEPLLPLFIGLFAVPTLLTSVITKTKIPQQKITKPYLPMKKLGKPFLATMLASPLCSFLPSLGSSQAAVIGSDLINTRSRKEFLFLVGSINTIVIGLSFITLIAIGKSRTGVASFLRQSINDVPLFLILGTIIISGIFAFFITMKIASVVANKIHKINYAYISLATLFIIVLLTFSISRFIGIVVLIVSASLGLYTIQRGVRRSQLLGCLMIPTILIYFPF